MSPDLGTEGRALVAAQVAQLTKLAGVAEDLRAEGRVGLEAEQADRTRRPFHLQQLGGGEVGIVPNMIHPGTPQQFHPPTA
jgi:hypothetical protein